MAKWLVKSEPTTYSIDDLQRERVTAWDGVRNYQARNFLMQMKIGEQVVIYHSQTEPIGLAGLSEVRSKAAADPTQFDKRSRYFDETASKDKPRWFCPDLQFVRRFDKVIPLLDLRKTKGLEQMELLRIGSRLSVQPVSEREFDILMSLVDG